MVLQIYSLEKQIMYFFPHIYLKIYNLFNFPLQSLKHTPKKSFDNPQNATLTFKEIPAQGMGGKKSMEINL